VKKQIQIAALMATAAMFTLAGYEFIRSAATVLFKNAYGAENLPLVMAAMPFVVFLGVALYGRILTALGPRRTLIVTSLGSALLIFACYLLVLNGSKAITPVLYLLKELYIVLLIEQYWSYINSNLSSDGAKKLNGPITGIAGIGGAIGGTLVGITATSWGTENMLLLASLSEFAGSQDEETALQGKFWGTLNTSVVVLQFLLVPLLMSFVSLRLIHILMPLIHLSAITVALISPSVLTVGVAFFLFKAFDYSLFRASKEVLYVPLGFDERYRAKEIIDVFGYRTGKGASSVGIVIMQKAGIVMGSLYLPIALIATAAWLALIFPLTRAAKATRTDS
jgi:ATP/ADP translocase